MKAVMKDVVYRCFVYQSMTTTAMTAAATASDDLTLPDAAAPV